MQFGPDERFALKIEKFKNPRRRRRPSSKI